VGTDNPAGKGRHRGNEQNATEPAFQHSGQAALGEQKRGSEVNGQRLVDVVGGDVIPILRPSVTRAGYEHVDRAEVGLDAIDEATRGTGVLEVGADGDGCGLGR
jgi:hypothetical protein